MDKIPKFNNKQNIKVRIKSSDEEHYISRAVSLDAAIMIREEDDFKVLITKRSEMMSTEPSKWCLPCGHLDWNETCYEGILREVYEEVGIYLPDHETFLVENNTEREFNTNSKPSNSEKGNVAFQYIFVYDFENIMPVKLQHLNICKNEVEDYKWVNLSDIFYNKLELDWAFNHDQVIKSAYYFYQSKR